MSALAPPLNAADLLQRLRAEGRVLLSGVSWEAYRALIDSVGERALLHTYDRGTLELVTRSREHEIYKCLLGRLIDVWADETLTPLGYGGEMTLQRGDVERGVEGDECFWVGNLERLTDPLHIDLSRDPPPDLVIEAEVSTTVVDRLSVYATLGVPEVWRVSASRIRVGRLQPDGQYQWGEQSTVFPALPLAEVLRFLQQAATTPDHRRIARDFRAWVRQQLGR
ncbi:MAG TPA: Uma2 family endonuclease [Gemmataceae bacterium]|nr:Uma2 family endonuclease [Gemmataceae bacterium]